MATGTTPNYSLPYPKSTDPVNVASDIQDLATSLDTDLSEIIQDLSSSMITGGTNYGISTSYNDTTGKLSIGVIDDGHSHIAGNIDDLQASLDLKSNIDSPVFTGNPTAPTPSLGDNDSSLATTSFVTSAIDAIESSAVYYQDDAPLSPEVGSVWVDSDEVFSSFSSNDFILKSGGVFTGNIDGTTASFTGSVSAPTAAALTSTTQLATTAFVTTAGNLKADLASPALTGVPAAPTAPPGTSTTQLATTDFVTVADNLKADRISEAITDLTISSDILTFDTAVSNVAFVATAPTANFTLNVTNAPTTDGRAITVVAFIVQGATGRIPSVLQIAAVGQTIKWQGGAAPTPTSTTGKIDVFSFTLIRRSAAWTVLGSALLAF